MLIPVHTPRQGHRYWCFSTDRTRSRASPLNLLNYLALVQRKNVNCRIANTVWLHLATLAAGLSSQQHQSCFGDTPVTASVISNMSPPLATSSSSDSATWMKASLDWSNCFYTSQSALSNFKVGLTILFFMRHVAMWLGSLAHFFLRGLSRDEVGQVHQSNW